MNKKSHLMITKELLSHHTNITRKQKALVMAGCVLPDFLLHTYIKGHTWKDRAPSVFRAIRLYEKKPVRHIRNFIWYGYLLHYIEDFFTGPHNLAFEGGFREHIHYESQIYRQLVNRHGEPLPDFGGQVKTAKQLIERLEVLHREYRKEKPEETIWQTVILELPRWAGLFSRLIDVISSIFAPFLYTLAACGILQGILDILVAQNAIDTAGGTYQILNFVSWELKYNYSVIHLRLFRLFWQSGLLPMYRNFSISICLS